MRRAICGHGARLARGSSGEPSTRPNRCGVPGAVRRPPPARRTHRSSPSTSRATRLSSFDEDVESPTFRAEALVPPGTSVTDVWYAEIDRRWSADRAGRVRRHRRPTRSGWSTGSWCGAGSPVSRSLAAGVRVVDPPERGVIGHPRAHRRCDGRRFARCARVRGHRWLWRVRHMAGASTSRRTPPCSPRRRATRRSNSRPTPVAWWCGRRCSRPATPTAAPARRRRPILDVRRGRRRDGRSTTTEQPDLSRFDALTARGRRYIQPFG